MSITLESLNRTVIGCRKCPRLVQYREKVGRDKVRRFSDCDYWARPLTGFGDRNARLLILGLAPAAHGGNRTGRMFTGDSSADFLMRGLHKAGFANQPFSRSGDDGLELIDAYMTAIVRCAPPGNKPTRGEIGNCNNYLATELTLLPNIRVVLALGRLAFDTYLSMLRRDGIDTRRYKFGHGALYTVPATPPNLVASYHPSRQNTQTGKLTPAMFDRVLRRIRKLTIAR
jgi:uracil-DNA glycosylase family 4